jgi:hypothetical protein
MVALQASLWEIRRLWVLQELAGLPRLHYFLLNYAHFSASVLVVVKM